MTPAPANTPAPAQAPVPGPVPPRHNAQGPRPAHPGTGPATRGRAMTADWPGWPCPDCGAGARQPCNPDCPRYEEVPGD